MTLGSTACETSPGLPADAETTTSRSVVSSALRRRTDTRTEAGRPSELDHDESLLEGPASTATTWSR